MVSSRALTVRQYLAELPPERREVIAAVRDVVNANLPRGYEETMNWGMICWEVPLSRYPDTYNGHPLAYLALAAQKGNFAFYTTGAYGDPALMAWLRAEYKRAGARLDMGKSCIRFRSLAGLPLPVVARLAANATIEEFIARHERSRHGTTKPAKRPAPRKTARAAAPKKAAKPAAGGTKAKPRPARKAPRRG